LVEWRKRLRAAGSAVKVTRVTPENPGEAVVGTRLKVEARVALGAVKPGDIRVQLYYGNVDEAGQIISGQSAEMSLQRTDVPEQIYSGEIECHDSGSCGYTVRIIPYNQDAILPYELPFIVWAE
jgi:starch phosphorylase